MAALAQAVPACVHMVGKHHELESELAKFTGQAGGKDNRVDAFVWPIYLYVVRRYTGAKPGQEGAGADEVGEGEE